MEKANIDTTLKINEYPEKKLVTMNEDKISFKLKNSLSELDTLYKNLEQFGKSLGLSIKCELHCKLALEELFSNIISYGYVNNAEHWIKFTISHENETIILHIEDDGIPFNLSEAASPDLECALEERKIGGLGVHLIKNFANDIVYQRCGNKNVVTLKLNLE